MRAIANTACWTVRHRRQLVVNCVVAGEFVAWAWHTDLPLSLCARAS